MAKHLKEPEPAFETKPPVEHAAAYTYQPDNIDELHAASQVESIPVIDLNSEAVTVPVAFEIPQLVPDQEPVEVADPYESTSPGVLGFGASTSVRKAEARPVPARSGRERSARAADLANWAAEIEARETQRHIQDALGARAVQRQSLDTLHGTAPVQPVQTGGFYDMK